MWLRLSLRNVEPYKSCAGWLQWKESVWAKGKGKANIYIESPLDKPTSPSPLNALLLDPSIYEEISMGCMGRGK